jgi:hypothetical protein
MSYKKRIVEEELSRKPPLGVGSAYVGLKACLQTCRKRGRLLLTRRRLELSQSEETPSLNSPWKRVMSSGA